MNGDDRVTDNNTNSPQHLLKGRYLVRSEKCPGQMSVVYLVHPVEVEVEAGDENSQCLPGARMS